MAWIKLISPAEAVGELKRQYDAALRRAGKVFNIIRVQCRRPAVLRASTRLYVEIMHSPVSALSRVQREMLAVAVSRANDCYY